jgi:hypothetical protein
MDAHELLDPSEIVRRVIGELKTATAEVPADRRAAFEQTLKRAEEMLAVARSKSAKELGFRIHDCKFPAPLMLWNESQRAHVCENCGHVRQSAGVRVHESSWTRSRRGGGGGNDGTGWMGR